MEVQGLRDLLRVASQMISGQRGGAVVGALGGMVAEESSRLGRHPEDIVQLCAALHSVLDGVACATSGRSKDTTVLQAAAAARGPCDAITCSCHPMEHSSSRVAAADLYTCRSTPAVMQVLQNDTLLLEIFDWLVHKPQQKRSCHRQARAALGRLSLVCRRWRDVAVCDCLWWPISQALFPASTPPQPPSHTAAASACTCCSSVKKATQKSCREHVASFGRALLQPRFRTSSQWQDGLSMIFEVHDEQDGRRLFYGCGALHVGVGQNVILRLRGTARTEVAEPFSAADRDPGRQRFLTLKDFFKTCHSSEYPASLRVRVVVRDDATGRLALLYQSTKANKRHAKVPNASYWQDFLPDDALYVWDSDTLQFTHDGKTQIKVAAAFYCVPVEGQDSDMSDMDRQYRIAGGDADRYSLHSSYVSLDFCTTDQEAVGRFVKALLGSDCPTVGA